MYSSNTITETKLIITSALKRLSAIRFTNFAMSYSK
jgi:hypothetical protein